MDNVTFAVGGVEGLISLYEDVPGLKGDQDDLLQQSVRKLSLQVHMLLHVSILTEVCTGDLNPAWRDTRSESRAFLDSFIDHFVWPSY